MENNNAMNTATTQYVNRHDPSPPKYAQSINHPSQGVQTTRLEKQRRERKRKKEKVTAEATAVTLLTPPPTQFGSNRNVSHITLISNALLTRMNLDYKSSLRSGPLAKSHVLHSPHNPHTYICKMYPAVIYMFMRLAKIGNNPPPGKNVKSRILEACSLIKVATHVCCPFVEGFFFHSPDSG